MFTNKHTKLLVCVDFWWQNLYNRGGKDDERNERYGCCFINYR